RNKMKNLNTRAGLSRQALFGIVFLLSTGIAFSQTWEKLNYTYTYSGIGVPQIFAAPDDGVLIAGVKTMSGPEISVSTDGGATWQQAFSDKTIVSAEFAPDGTIYLMTSQRYLTTQIFNIDTLYTS